jgi:hypothetical protein
MKTFAFELSGRVIVWCGTQVTPSVDEWNAYVKVVRDHVARHTSPCSLVWANGGGPSTLQRRQLGDVVPARTQVSIVVQNPIERGIATAFMWLVRGTKVFAPGELPAALDHLALTPRERELVAAALERLRAEVTQQSVRRAPTGTR